MKALFGKKILFTTIVVLLLDQGSKYAIEHSLNEGDVIPIINRFFNLVLTYNRGVAFGIFSTINDNLIRHSILSITTVLALGAVYVFAKQPGSEKGGVQVALGMILGGAFGNIIDRVIQGAVTDFLDFYYKGYHWPAFNIADSAICIAIAILLLSPMPASQSALEKKTVV